MALSFFISYIYILHENENRCVSAVLDIYAPVFVAAVLLSAILPATLELSIVPLLAPYLYRKQQQQQTLESSSSGATPLSSITSPQTRHAWSSSVMVSRWLLLMVRSSSWNVNAVLYGSKDISLHQSSSTSVYSSRRVIERGFSQLLALLVIALTFGLTAPFVGVSCGTAALISICHHWSVLLQIVNTFDHRRLLGRLDRTTDDDDDDDDVFVPTSRQPTTDNSLSIDLATCNSVPWSCALVIMVVSVAVWVFICWEYLIAGYVLLGFCILSGLVSFWVIFLYHHHHHHHK
jgi:hypothetical protein